MLRTLVLLALVAVIVTATVLRFFAVAVLAGVMLAGLACLVGACGKAVWQKLRHGGSSASP